MILGGKKTDLGALRPSEADNLVRWSPNAGKRGHVESFFIKWNLPQTASAKTDPLGAPESNSPTPTFPSPTYEAFWLKFTILHHDDGRPPVGEVWAIVFDTNNQDHMALKNRFAPADWELEEHVFFLRFGASEIRHGQSSGKLEGTKNTIRWNITWSPRAFGVRHFPYDWMYKGPFPRNKMTTPQPDARISGWVDVSGQRVEFQDAPGMQGHNWGVAHPASWQWAHTNMLTGNGRAVFEAVTGRVAIGGLLLPEATLIYLEYNGEPILINGLLEAFRSSSKLEGFRWTLGGNNGEYRVEACFEAQREDFVGVNYQNPDGTVMRCLNSKISSAKILLSKKEDGGWRLIDELSAHKTAAFEIGKSGDSLGVAIRIP